MVAPLIKNGNLSGASLGSRIQKSPGVWTGGRRRGGPAVLRTNLAAEFMFGGGAKQSTHNSASDDARPGFVRGALAYGASDVSGFSATSYLNTSVVPGSDFSFAMLIRPGTNATGDIYFSTGAQAAGSMVLSPIGTSLQWWFLTSGSSGNRLHLTLPATSPHAPTTDYRIIAGAISGLTATPTGILKEYMKDGATSYKTSTVVNFGTNSRSLDGKPIQLGAALGYAIGADFNAGAACFWDAALTEAQLDAEAVSMLAYAAANGLA